MFKLIVLLSVFCFPLTALADGFVGAYVTGAGDGDLNDDNNCTNDVDWGCTCDPACGTGYTCRYEDECWEDAGICTWASALPRSYSWLEGLEEDDTKYAIVDEKGSLRQYVDADYLDGMAVEVYAEIDYTTTSLDYVGMCIDGYVLYSGDVLMYATIKCRANASSSWEWHYRTYSAVLDEDQDTYCRYWSYNPCTGQNWNDWDQIATGYETGEGVYFEGGWVLQDDDDGWYEEAYVDMAYGVIVYSD